MSLNSTVLSQVAKELRNAWEGLDVVKIKPGLLLRETSIAFGIEKIAASVGTLRDALEAATKVDKALLKLVQDEIRDFQRRYSLLEEDGILGARTLSILSGLLGCPGNSKNKKEKTPAGFEFRDENNQKTDHIWFMFFIESTPNTLPNAQELIHNAWDSWKEVALIRSREVQRIEDSNVVIRKKSLDGPNGTLGQAHVGPVTKNFRLEIEMDDREIWTATKFQAAVCHEIGHILGLEHTPGSAGLMSTHLGPNKTKPTPIDIEAVRRKYGPPLKMPIVEPEPLPDDAPDHIRKLQAQIEELQRSLGN